MQIYPIVLLLRFKSAKQIKDLKENTFGTTDKNSAKAAKEMYERALKFESDYKQYISGRFLGFSSIRMNIIFCLSYSCYTWKRKHKLCEHTN